MFLGRASLRDTKDWVLPKFLRTRLLRSQRSFNKYIFYDQKKIIFFCRMNIYLRKIYNFICNTNIFYVKIYFWNEICIFYIFIYIFSVKKVFFSKRIFHKTFFPYKNIFSANDVYFVKNKYFFKKTLFFQLSFTTDEQPYSVIA